MAGVHNRKLLGVVTMPWKGHKYKEKYCQLYIDCQKKGMSITEFAAKVGVSRQAIWKWKKNYPEFAEAAQIAETAGQAFWEDELKKMMYMGRDINGMLVKLYFANRFKWHDKDSEDEAEKQSPSFNLTIQNPGA